MAQDFVQWLESCYFQLAPYKDTRITVVTVIGKETADNLKSSTINQLLLDQNSAFGCGTWSFEQGLPISVDAFFSPESSILYLLVNGINDARTQSYLFGSGRFRDKSFFEKLAIAEMESIHLLHLVFILSHLVIFIEQSCRFDTEWLRTLKAVKYLRLSEKLARRGQIGSSKDAFAFHRSPLRADLGVAKRKELLEKLEKSLEGQLVSLLKHHKIVDKHSPESALACLPPIPNEFAYIFRPKEISSSADDTGKDLVNELFCKAAGPEGRTTAVPHDVDKLLAELEAGCERSGERTGRDSHRASEYDFNTFVKNAISDMRSNSSSTRSKEYVYEFPRLKNFIVAAKVLYKKLIAERNFDFTHVVQKINAEVLVQENSTDANMQKALDIYEQHLKTPAASTLAFSHQEHEEKLQQAIRYLSGREVSGERLNRLIRSLTEKCTAIWNDGNQRCEAMSLTGHQCALPIHESDERFHSNARSTGFQLLSTCNCGKSQAIRLDPFTHKQANYDFYEQTCFECCANGEKFKLPVFEPEWLNSSEDQGESEDEIKVEEDDVQESPLYEMNLQQVRILSRKTSSPPKTAEEEETEQMTNQFSAHFYDNNHAAYQLAGNGAGKSSHNDNENISEPEEESDYKTASVSESEQSCSDQEEKEESEEEEEEVRRQKLSQPNSASEYDESDEAENNEETVSTQQSLSTNNSRKKGTLQSRRENDRKTFLLPAKKKRIIWTIMMCI